MRVLVLTQVVVYPADAGPKIKTLHVIEHLAADHEVTYCTFTRNEQDRHNAEQLATLCSRVATVPMQRSRVSDLRYLVESLAHNDSFILRRDDRPAMHATVRQLIEEERIDVIHVDQLNMMRFIPADWNGPVILDEHNAVWQVFERLRTGSHNPLVRWLLKREVRCIRRLEAAACRRARTVLAVSQQDKRSLLALIDEGTSLQEVDIEVIPITVDVEKLQPIYAARAPQPGRLLTIGTMFWPPNSEGVSWWLREGYALLQRTCPDVVYDIVGARPASNVQQAARQHTGVMLHGYVADATPFWTQTSALVVPLLSGGGVRVKILEAMAMGVPVISTQIGCEGLDVQHEEHLLIADTPAELAQACTRLLGDPELAHRLAQNAHQLIVEQYASTIALQKLDTVYQQLATSIYA